MSGEGGHGCEMANGYYSWLTTFQMFDTNYDGYIATHDLRRFVRNSATSFGLSRQEADALLKNIDKNDDHLLDFAEFCTLFHNNDLILGKILLHLTNITMLSA
uniref:EF-hand domain-containing protein n=1 Tax=Wuchereria bancrofti TaxID=6293 RepID=A0A1I8ELS7_WUCBA